MWGSTLILISNLTLYNTIFLVVLFYLLLFSRFSVEVCNFLLITLRDTPQSVGLHWTRDRLDAEASTWQQHSQETNIHDPGGFEPTILASERPKTHALDRTATHIFHTRSKPLISKVKGGDFVYSVTAQ
jgi:hypothetical protein